MNFQYNSFFNIEDLSFRVKKNSVYALIGNNGAGKTTVLKLLVGLLKPKSGSIKIFDEILTRKKDQLWKLRQKIGFLFQNPDDQLFAPTIEEDIAFGARNLMLDEGEVKDRVYKALEAVDLLEFKEHSPFNLSWGQKKKAALAGLLVMKPNLLILDEPFENLDLKSIYNHLIIFEKLRKEERLTIIYSTHNLFFIENWAENVLLLDRGKGIFEGDPKEGLMNPRMKSIMGSYAELKELIDKHKKIATNIHI